MERHLRLKRRRMGRWWLRRSEPLVCHRTLRRYFQFDQAPTKIRIVVSDSPTDESYMVTYDDNFTVNVFGEYLEKVVLIPEFCFFFFPTPDATTRPVWVSVEYGDCA